MAYQNAINQEVNINALYFRARGGSLKSFPKRMEYDGREYTFLESGLQMLLGKGHDLIKLFDMTDGKQTYAVAYRGIAPDTFTDGVDVVVEGRMGADGTFQATTLLAKCASRYENAPGQGDEKYKQTPGYKAGTRA